MFSEATHGGGFFVSEHPSSYYKKNHDKAVHERGFAMFNAEILQMVKSEYGPDLFRDVDMIILFGTDAGRGWYVRNANATGYGMLGIDFEAGGNFFGRRQRQGGLTLEIGSDVGTADPDDDIAIRTEEIYWTLAHEYGHWLGLGHRGRNLGLYSLMVRQLHGNTRMPEFGPPPLDLFHIIQLGWLDATDASRVIAISMENSATLVELQQIRARSEPVVLQIDLAGARESLFITYHSREENPFDAVYAGEGLLVWHKRAGRIDLRCGLSEGKTGKDHLDEGVDLSGRPGDFLDASQGEVVLYERAQNSGGKSVLALPKRIIAHNIQPGPEDVSFAVRFEQ